MGEEDKHMADLTEIPQIEEEKAKELYKNGCESLDDILAEGVEGLINNHQIDEKVAKKILEEAKILKKSKEEDDESADELIREMNKLKEVVTKAESDIRETPIDKDIEERKEDKKALEKEIQDLKEEKKRVKENVDDFSDQISDLKDKKDELEEEIDEVKEKKENLEEVEERLKELKKVVDEKKEEKESLEDDLEELKKWSGANGTKNFLLYHLKKDGK